MRLEKSFAKSITIAAVLLVLVTAAFFMVNVELPAWSHWLSGLNVVLFAVPCFWAAKQWLGARDAIYLFVIMGVFALLVETSAILTGFPYGNFGYSDLLGFRLFGITPWTVALAWTPLVIGAYAIARSLILNVLLRISAVSLILVAFDAVLDPGAVRFGFWRYEASGNFYGVPISNFFGWIVSGLAAAIVLEIFFRYVRPLLPVPVQLVNSSFLIIFFWTAIAFFSGMTVPALIGLLILIGLIIFYRRYYYSFDEMIVLVDEVNNPISTMRKLAAHDSDTKLHRAFSVFLFNSKGELLLQQRATTKKTWPGVWSNSCCGHPMLFESAEAAASRRLNDELGIKNADLHLVLPDFRYRAEKDGIVENEICPVLAGFTNEEPKINKSEVEAVRWLDWNEASKIFAEPANGYSPWAVQEIELLKESELFNHLMEKNTNCRDQYVVT